jgi:assimilatory nitrate reductase catalytic subunit
MPGFGFASCVPFGREAAETATARVGLLFRAAGLQPASAERLQAIERALAVACTEGLRYADPRGGQHRVMVLTPDGALQAFVLAGDTAAQAWVLNLLQQGAPAAGLGRALLLARAEPPTALARPSPQVCACHDVSEAAILAALPGCVGAGLQKLAPLQARLRCGTDCGSCLPAVKALLQREALAQPVPI